MVLASESHGKVNPLMHKTLRSIALSFALLAGVLTGPTIVETALDASPAAAASTRTGTVIAPQWWGWCPKTWYWPTSRNRVTSVAVVNLTAGGTWHRWGDSVDVRLRPGWNHLQVQTTCAFNTPAPVQVWVRSDRNGQKHYVGFPSGSWSN